MIQVKSTLFILTIFGLTDFAFAQNMWYELDSSQIEVHGTSTIHDWVMTASGGEGHIIEQENNELIDVNFVIAVSSLKSSRGNTMDTKAYNAFKSTQHPYIELTVLNLKAISKGTDTLKCSLKMAGVTKNFSTECQIDTCSNTISARGGFPIKFADYNMTPPSAMFGQIVCGDVVNVNYYLLFRPKKEN
ncbi:MAG: YceI family protein [Bacteroidales bacterium]